jgi:hypothetical protein
MRIRDARQWNNQNWTRLYEAALFERDTLRLCACIWTAQMAIFAREQEIHSTCTADQQEIVALKRALGILKDLGRLSGLDHHTDPPIKARTLLPGLRGR